MLNYHKIALDEKQRRPNPSLQLQNSHTTGDAKTTQTHKNNYLIRACNAAEKIPTEPPDPVDNEPVSRAPRLLQIGAHPKLRTELQGATRWFHAPRQGREKPEF